jgi:hypothetical protein
VESDVNLLVDAETAAKLAEQLRRAATVDECHILPKNWETFLFWQRISSHWLYGAMGGIIGIDWSTVYAKINIYKLSPEKELRERYGFGHVTLLMLEGIEAMEREARRVLNEKYK